MGDKEFCNQKYLDKVFKYNYTTFLSLLFGYNLFYMFSEGTSQTFKVLICHLDVICYIYIHMWYAGDLYIW